MSELGLDFELQPGRVRIDLDNLVRLAIDGLRDAGLLQRGMRGTDVLVATKRSGRQPGLAITYAMNSSDAGGTDPFGSGPDLVVRSSRLPDEERPEEKAAWRDAVAAVRFNRHPGDVGVDIEVRTERSLAGILKPVIDGLEPYLGREPRGQGVLRPEDHRITWLRIRRNRSLADPLQVRAGRAPASWVGRTIPPMPSLPEMDPGFAWSMSDNEAIARHAAWRRSFGTDMPDREATI